MIVIPTISLAGKDTVFLSNHYIAFAMPCRADRLLILGCNGIINSGDLHDCNVRHAGMLTDGIHYRMSVCVCSDIGAADSVRSTLAMAVQLICCSCLIMRIGWVGQMYDDSD